MNNNSSATSPTSNGGGSVEWRTIEDVIDGTCANAKTIALMKRTPTGATTPPPKAASPPPPEQPEEQATPEDIAQERLASTAVDVSDGAATAAPPPLARQKSDPPSRPHPSSMGIALQRGEHCYTMVTVTPPQTNGMTPPTSPTSGAHCLVLDASGSMTSAATITTDDGDKVSHGFTLLDIVKHATCTYIASLSASDFIRIVVYGSSAVELAPWTACTDEGKKALDALVRGQGTIGSTNMVEGIRLGAKGFGELLPAEVKASPHEYAMSLVVCTDGLPDDASKNYAGFVASLKSDIEESNGAAARPTVTAIGFGNSLNSAILSSFSDTFLHIPDPGSVGPFIVNLVAATRATAKIVAPGRDGGVVANTTRLVISPADEVLDVPGFAAMPSMGTAVAVEMGPVQYDQPRHVLVRTKHADTALSVTLEVGGFEVASAKATADAAASEAAAFKAQLERVAVLCCLTHPSAMAAQGRTRKGKLQRCVELMADSPLKATVTAEVLLGLEDGKFHAWGKHYARTLPYMLRLERRSNFRDACLQGFGKDSRGADGLFEELSNDSEMVFAQLTPPTPSGTANRHVGGGGGAPTTYTSLPDEFMRGGGCFGPDATVAVLAPGEGAPRAVRVSAVRAGDALVGEGGRVATVVCVVMTECAGGRAQLTRLPNGTEITEWHPIRDASTGKWRFPNMLGTRILRTTPFVYNFVLSEGHPTILVDGVPCAALGHGLEAPVVAHPYWGTRAVIDDLMQRDGWAAGRVVLPAKY